MGGVPDRHRRGKALHAIGANVDATEGMLPVRPLRCARCCGAQGRRSSDGPVLYTRMFVVGAPRVGLTAWTCPIPLGVDSQSRSDRAPSAPTCQRDETGPPRLVAHAGPEPHAGEHVVIVEIIFAPAASVEQAAGGVDARTNTRLAIDAFFGWPIRTPAASSQPQTH